MINARRMTLREVVRVLFQVHVIHARLSRKWRKDKVTEGRLIRVSRVGKFSDKAFGKSDGFNANRVGRFFPSSAACTEFL